VHATYNIDMILKYFKSTQKMADDQLALVYHTTPAVTLVYPH